MDKTKTNNSIKSNQAVAAEEQVPRGGASLPQSLMAALDLSVSRNRHRGSRVADPNTVLRRHQLRWWSLEDCPARMGLRDPSMRV